MTSHLLSRTSIPGVHITGSVHVAKRAQRIDNWEAASDHRSGFLRSSASIHNVSLFLRLRHVKQNEGSANSSSNMASLKLS